MLQQCFPRFQRQPRLAINRLAQRLGAGGATGALEPSLVEWFVNPFQRVGGDGGFFLLEYVGNVQSRCGSSRPNRPVNRGSVHIAGFFAGENASNKIACGAGNRRTGSRESEPESRVGKSPR